MGDPYLWLKWVHILSAAVLFGTGLGTAFQMWAAHLRRDDRAIAVVARNVVIADLLFTTPAIVVQPTSGIALIVLAGFDPWASWLVVAYALYLLAGLCWLPVVVIQIRVRDEAAAAVAERRPLPARYYRLIRAWFILGWPAFVALIAVFALMVAKPALW